MPEYVCEVCKCTFISNRESRFGIKYCSDACRATGWKEYMRKREGRSRENSRDVAIKEFVEKQGIDAEKLQYLIEHQQFETEIPLEEKCWLCDSIIDLLDHHVTYFPIQERHSICRKCHEFLHKVIFRGRKCKPKNGNC